MHKRWPAYVNDRTRVFCEHHHHASTNILSYPIISYPILPVYSHAISRTIDAQPTCPPSAKGARTNDCEKLHPCPGLILLFTSTSQSSELL